MKDVNLAIGIDLGTTNSVVAIYRSDQPETLEVEGTKLVPSVVSFRDKKTIMVGKKAKAGMEIYPETTVSSIKRHMGNRNYQLTAKKKIYTPIDISAMILRKLADAASESLDGKITKAVITVPAYFNNNQKEDTRKAGEKAGLKVLRLIPEPTAAAIAYGLEKEKNQTILVYDFGGGTFDVSILKVKGRDFKVIAVNGDHDLGGDDIDRKIMNYLLEEFKKQSKISSKKLAGITEFREQPQVNLDKKSDNKEGRVQQLLKEAAERAKIELSFAMMTSVDIPDIMDGESLSVELSRSQFENMIKNLLARTEKPIRQALKDANLEADDIDRVVLVGGSTKIPLVKEMVSKMIREPFTAENVDEQVAHGAAIVAASLAVAEAPEEYKETPPPPIEFTNVTAFSLGIQIRGNDNVHAELLGHVFSEIILKQTELPKKEKGIYTTVEDNQKAIDIKVFQGTENDCRKNLFLGEFTLSDIQVAPKGVPQVEVTFNMDEDDILDVTARDLTTQASGKTQIKVTRA